MKIISVHPAESGNTYGYEAETTSGYMFFANDESVAMLKSDKPFTPDTEWTDDMILAEGETIDEFVANLIDIEGSVFYDVLSLMGQTV